MQGQRQGPSLQGPGQGQGLGLQGQGPSLQGPGSGQGLDLQGQGQGLTSLVINGDGGDDGDDDDDTDRQKYARTQAHFILR